MLPRSQGGKDTTSICRDCHKQIHILFNIKKLAKELYNVESLLKNNEFSKYVEWVKNKPIGIVKKPKKYFEKCRKIKLY